MGIQPLADLLLNGGVVGLSEANRVRVGDFLDLIGERLRGGADRRQHRFGRRQALEKRQAETLGHHFHRADFINHDEVFAHKRQLQGRDADVFQGIQIDAVLAQLMRTLEALGGQHPVLAVEGVHDEPFADPPGENMLRIKPADARSARKRHVPQERRFPHPGGPGNKKVFDHGMSQSR